jgi:methionine synthase II (cobalamin-independent)
LAASPSEKNGNKPAFAAAGEIVFTPVALHVSRKLTLEHTIFGDDFQFLKSMAKATPKLTIPAPSLIHYRGGRASIDESVYPDLDQFWDDVGRVYADEVEALGRLGCTYLQLDDTSLAYTTIRSSASISRSSEATPRSSTSPTSRRSTRRWPGNPPG